MKEKMKEKKNINIHNGHRQRLRERYIASGIDGFADHNILELLLTYAIPRIDVNPLAHSLMDHFGSLAGVLDASVEELQQAPGIGQSAAVLISLIPQINKRYIKGKTSFDGLIRSSHDAGEYLKPVFLYEREEVVHMLCLDNKRKLLCCREISRGVVNGVDISIRRIVETALSQNSSFVIMAHNHLSGIALPSAEDEVTTLQIKKALDMVGIGMMDHIIVAYDDYVSMSDSGML